MKFIKILAPLIAICLLFSACSNNTSLSDLSIVQCVGIDKDNADTRVTLQYLNLGKGGSTTEALAGDITSVATGKSKSVSTAVNNAGKSLAQRVFFGQNKLLLLGSEYAKNCFTKSNDYLLRSVDSREDVLVAVCSSLANDVVQNKENKAIIPADSICSTILTGQQNGSSVAINASKLNNMACTKGGDIYLPVITGNDNSVKCTGIAVFSNGKYATTLYGNNCLALLLLNNFDTNAPLTVKSSTYGNADLEIISYKTKYKFSNGVLSCNISLKLMLNEMENGNSTSIDENALQSLEYLAKTKIQSICYNAVNTCVDYKCDAFNINEYVAKYDIDYYNKNIDNWRNNLANIKYDISAKASIQRVDDNARRQ